ncbi:acyl-CoA dehydrogenase family protein [Burkholderia multivorans]|uniref:acyl-CoA dehydrogenase family protein n=1 Tax=Burkholderia multivorans TaxID=87883 RepID=UPI001C278677|nr:acyl-CoA dehydrogenase [Burkholderia multivorans]MBU9597945.1 acyl-CoA dehydrogenase [Burkholderia multivorans]MDN8000218.1 acyl-CoA dehydrogenase [Burkholderia multivorans]WVN01608.1 acyl-CoA dehydrogenase [Burkholderia multivorans]
MNSHEQTHTIDSISAALADRGLDLALLATRMRTVSLESDATGQIIGPPWRAEDVKCLNMNLVPIRDGGCPALQSLVAQATLMVWLGEADASLALALPGPGLAMPPIVALASTEQQGRFFQRFQSGNPRWGAFAITEPDCGSDATAMRTSARKTDRGWVLNGTKCFITNGARADCVITFATINRQMGRYGIRAFVVDSNTPGFAVSRIERMAGLRATQLTVLSYTDCEVTDDALLARGDERPVDDAFAGAQRSWDYFRPLLSAVMVGACRRVRADLAAWLEAGGTPTNRHHGVASVNASLLDIDREIAAAWLLCHCTAWKTDRGITTSLDSSMTKAFASRVSARVTRAAMDLAGIDGIAACPSLEQAYRDARAFDIMEGTGDLQRLMIARAAQRSTSRPWDITVPPSCTPITPPDSLPDIANARQSGQETPHDG